MSTEMCMHRGKRVVGLRDKAMRRVLVTLTMLASLFGISSLGHADTVASLLGNFTINQFSGIKIGGDAATVRYTVVFGQLPALRELHIADVDGDGVTSQAERDAYVERLAPTFADQLKLTVDGVATPLKATHWSSSLPTEQGGFSLRLDVDLAASLPLAGIARHVVEFSNQNYPGRFGWQEMQVEAAPATKVFDTNAFSTSLTEDLTDAVASMPDGGPLNERAVHFTFTDGPVPAGAAMIQARNGTAAKATNTASGSTVPEVAIGETAWLQTQTRRLITLISAPDVAPHVLLLALLAAVVLGALHAFSPGHGKTVVGAYLIGSRGTPRHAVFLGVTVTVTHTLGVFALGFATLFASRFIVPERLFPILSLASGLLVLGMGIVLLAQRWQAARNVLSPPTPKPAGTASMTTFRPVASAALARRPGSNFVLAYAQGHRHDADHHHHHDGAHHHHGDAAHTHVGAGMHSHGGGKMHSHLPPGAAGERVTWRALLALGISGGLVPCPSAMVLLLAAVALNKTALGLLLVVAFSVGLAMTLTAVGLAFLYARNRIGAPKKDARWPHLLPVASAFAITLLGVVLCYGALSGASIGI